MITMNYYCDYYYCSYCYHDDYYSGRAREGRSLLSERRLQELRTRRAHPGRPGSPEGIQKAFRVEGSWLMHPAAPKRVSSSVYTSRARAPIARLVLTLR